MSGPVSFPPNVSLGDSVRRRWRWRRGRPGGGGGGGGGGGSENGNKAAREKSSKGKMVRRDAAAVRSKRAPLKRAAESAEYRLNQATRQKTDIEAKMADSTLYEGAPERLAELGRKLSAAERSISEAEADWLRAAEALEALQAEDSSASG